MLYLTSSCLPAIIWIASTEMITWMDIQKYSASNKLALSILWGVYALLLIVLGIWKKKKHLRIGAIALFAATLIKLFFYDISSLATISKTIVFVSLGVLLLIISFLYNKYKHLTSRKKMKNKIPVDTGCSLLLSSLSLGKYNDYRYKRNITRH